MTTATISPTSNMPPAARRQVEAANALIAELNAKPGQVPAGTEVQVMPNDQTPGGNETDSRRTWQPAPPSATAQPVSQDTQAPPAQLAAAPVEQEDFRQKYSTLQGKYNAEMKAMREIMASQQQTMDKLIESRQSSVAPAPAAPEQTPQEYLKSLGVSDKEIEDYGELLPIMVKMAQNMIRPTAAKLEAELEKTKKAAGTVASAQMKSAQDSLFAYMDQKVPQWRVINEHENFLAWLDGVDIFSGTSRRQSLASAFEALNSARVAAIFEKFIQEDSASRSASAPPVSRETLIAPGVPRGGAAEAPGGASGKRIWSEGEIKDFYTRVRRKQVTPEQYTQFSAEIAAAVSEGRVKPDRNDHHQNR
ncbi:MAG: hypothetical protein M3O20_17955 [Acidobacteriota bacterium]|nr:hypothetical protein [Acidobacteriota bacterium]